MQVLQAGPHKILQLELDAELVENLARQAGFEPKVHDQARVMVVELSAGERKSPLLLFDAADPGNLGWFSRCTFYVDGRTGLVLQTPISLGNLRGRNGRPVSNGLRLQIAKELPPTFRLPGRQPVTEQVVYAVLLNFLNALTKVGVGVCGGPVILPLAGRQDDLDARN
ncbi:MAG: hypothetical protein HY822_04770 [Acidobacteria bacterium]|nr:hypothetical protein [Acidobacteriota bacterium]